MPLTILVVEDYAPLREVTCAALHERATFRILEAADGLEAVGKAEELQPDLVLLDLNLPKMSGFEAAKRIRRLTPHARVLFMSQESSPDIVRKALSLGAYGYFRRCPAATDLLLGDRRRTRGPTIRERSLAFTGPTMLRSTRPRDSVLSG
jgi:CheY-like chemotaxis protein